LKAAGVRAKMRKDALDPMFGKKNIDKLVV